MARSSVVLSCLLALSLPFVPVRAGADGPDGEDDLSVIAFFQVGSLTAPRSELLPVRVGIVPPDEAGDEEQPLFGGETEGNDPPFGSTEDLLEWIVQHVEPGAWQNEPGAEISLFGDTALEVAGPPDLVGAVDASLKTLEARAHTTVTIDVATVAVPPDTSFAGPADLLDACPNGPVARITVLAGQEASVFAGAQVAYLQGYDVDVSAHASASDPQVGVLNAGLSVLARPTVLHDPDRIRLALDVRLATLEGLRATGADASSERSVELPEVDVVRARAVMLLEPGVWTVVEGAAAGEARPWLVLVRASASPAASPDHAADRPALSFRPEAPGDAGPVASEHYDLSDLAPAAPPPPEAPLHLWPSMWVPPEPDESPEPPDYETLLSDTDLWTRLVAPSSWHSDGVGIEAGPHGLAATNGRHVLDQMRSTLATLRRALLRRVVVDVDVVDVPPGLARLLAGPGTDGALLSPHAREALDAALEGGQATRTGHVRVASLAGAANAVFAGRQVSYLADYEIETAESSSIARPVVVTSCEGLEARIHPWLAGDASGVDLVVRLTQADLDRPLRTIDTVQGPIQAPRMNVSRTRTELWAPFERTVLVGAGTRGRGVRLFLATSHLVLLPR